jgi:hypothetical protein
MENEWNIQQDFGCMFLSKITLHFPGDQEVLNAAKRFMFVAMRSYVNAIKFAAPMRLRPLQSEGEMTKLQLFEFMEGNVTLN